MIEGYTQKNNLGVTRNPSKIITITRDDNVSWKSLLSSILNDERNKASIIGGGFTDYNVNSSSVELLLNQNLPQIDYKTNLERPIKNFMQGSTRSGNKVSDFIGKLGSAVSTAVNFGTAMYDALERAQGGEQATTSEVWNPWLNSVPTWVSSEKGLTFNYKFTFAMGQYGLWNAEEEVVKPLLNLFAPVLPRYVSSFTSSGPMPHVLELISRIGDVSDTERSDIQKETNVLRQTGMWIEKAVMNAYKSFKYTVSFGNIVTFNQCLITGATINLSNQTDNKGFPISGDITLRFETLVPVAMYTDDASLLSMRFGTNKETL